MYELYSLAEIGSTNFDIGQLNLQTVKNGQDRLVVFFLKKIYNK